MDGLARCFGGSAGDETEAERWAEGWVLRRSRTAARERERVRARFKRQRERDEKGTRTWSFFFLDWTSLH